MTTRRNDPQDVLHELCKNLEMQNGKDAETEISRILIRTRTNAVQTAFKFDQDRNGFQHFTPLIDNVEKGEAEKLALAAIQNPPRELSPVFSENVFGVQGAKSQLPKAKKELLTTFLDVFGRIQSYVDNDLPEIINKASKRK